MEENHCFLFGAGTQSFLGKVPPTVGTGHSTHYLLLGMK